MTTLTTTKQYVSTTQEDYDALKIYLSARYPDATGTIENITYTISFDDLNLTVDLTETNDFVPTE